MLVTFELVRFTAITEMVRKRVSVRMYNTYIYHNFAQKICICTCMYICIGYILKCRSCIVKFDNHGISYSYTIGASGLPDIHEWFSLR